MHQNPDEQFRSRCAGLLMHVDLHDFAQMAVWLDDDDLANTFQVQGQEATWLRRQMQRN